MEAFHCSHQVPELLNPLTSPQPSFTFPSRPRPHPTQQRLPKPHLGNPIIKPEILGQPHHKANPTTPQSHLTCKWPTASATQPSSSPPQASPPPTPSTNGPPTSRVTSAKPLPSALAAPRASHNAAPEALYTTSPLRRGKGTRNTLCRARCFAWWIRGGMRWVVRGGVSLWGA